MQIFAEAVKVAILVLLLKFERPAYCAERSAICVQSVSEQNL